MATAIITQPAAEAVLASVPFDHRTTGGLPLPNFGNSGRLDIERLRAALIMLDGLVAGLPASIDARFSALVGAAPAALDTVYELAEALQNNPDVIDEILTALGLRATKAELATAVTTLQGLIGQRAAAADLAALDTRVGALETSFPTRARLIARAIAYSGVR